MKKLILLLIAAFNLGCFAQAQSLENEHKHARPFTPEEEEKYFAQLERERGNKKWKTAFGHTRWNECVRPFTGNYTGANCARQRRIGEILFDYMDEQMKNCLEQISSEMGFEMEDFHVVHNGIYADRNHSPRSLHSVGRAIDIKTIKILKPDGTSISFNYGKDGLGTFYTKLRSCWGKVVHQWNSCPVLGRYDRTGSVGKENRDHQHHLHISVPYCVAGAYSSRYYRK